MTRSRAIALFIFGLTLMIVIYPEVAFQASLDGLTLWLQIVLPSLLPFFILADLLMGFGVVHFLGSLLEPIMRPLFRIPGAGGFAVAMAFAAGYPLGAKITGELARKKLITTVEAERLVSLAHTASPLFLVGAVAVGMFGRPELGVVLILSHYLGALFVGFCMRLHKGPETPRTKTEGAYLHRALRAMDQARKADGRSFGKLFADTVRNTFQAMFFIGGCIMIFSVLVQVLTATGILHPLRMLIGYILGPNLADSVLHGFFETTLGAQTASLAQASLQSQAVIASLVIGWSGLSVHSQVAAMLTDSNVRLSPYLWARLIHGIVSAMIAGLLLGPVSFIPTSLSKVLPALSTPQYLNGTFAARFLASARLATSFLLILVIILTLVWIGKRLIYISFRTRS